MALTKSQKIGIIVGTVVAVIIIIIIVVLVVVLKEETHGENGIPTPYTPKVSYDPYTNVVTLLLNTMPDHYSYDVYRNGVYITNLSTIMKLKH